MTTPMMKCGHAANAVNTATGKPSCASCAGLTRDAEIVAEAPDLGDRKARCRYWGSVPTGRLHESNYDCQRGQVCRCERPSSTDLPFFQSNPTLPHDTFYCGCWGWD